MLQKELSKRLRDRYDTKMDGNGWLEVSSDGIPLCRIKYNGQFQMLCFIQAEYNGKTEFLYLPCEEEAIDKAFARLGAPTPDDVELSWEDICIENEKWTERFKEIAAEEGVYELNRLAAAGTDPADRQRGRGYRRKAV